jgi:hypothetical protein
MPYRIYSKENGVQSHTIHYSPAGFWIQIRISLSCWIRIRIQNADPDPSPQLEKCLIQIWILSKSMRIRNFLHLDHEPYDLSDPVPTF